MTRASVLVLLAVSAGMTAGAQQRPIRVDIDLVHFGVTVTDKKGTPITGLAAQDFEIVESGTKQAVKFFAAGDPVAAPPLHLGFLVDMSGSMTADISDVRTAAIKFLKRNEHAVDVTLVDFDTEVRVARYGPNDYPRLIERIRSRRPDGWTALYDALGMYLISVATDVGQKILVLYTDGGDTRSTTTYKDVVDLLRASDVTVYAVGYLEHQPSSVKMDQRMQLQRFAQLTGGQAFFPMSVKEIDKLYDEVQREIDARYTLGYSSTNERADGAWREVRIKLTRADLKGAKLRTRGGYFAPFKEASPPRH
ncbi:MAG: VWA domain-containing protein [Acidobacteria bacterium]|nr:VWA domain-containing protein [Acidobacteriota bacterium]MCA1649218.1 VWA domain-containing protein [Acidobacteriota bacterium]